MPIRKRRRRTQRRDTCSRRSQVDSQASASTSAARGDRSSTIRKVLVLEYVPLLGTAATWVLLGLAIGHADLLRLFAATTFVMAIRAICTIEVTPTLARYVTADPAIYRRSRRLCFRIDVLATVACMVAASALVFVLHSRGMDKPAAMLAIGALSIPARHPGAIFVADRSKAQSWKLGSVIWGVCGAAVVLVNEWGWVEAAIVIALRPWFALLHTAVAAPARAQTASPPTAPLRFAEAAANTWATARRRLSYRVMRSLFMVFLGPFASVAARTGRRVVDLDTKLAIFIPRSRTGLFAIALSAGASAGAILAVSTEPSALLVAAIFCRIGAPAGAASLWWSYSADLISEGEEDDD